MTFKAWIKTITFYEIFVGMKVTMSHMLHYRPVTLQYPHEKRTLPDNYRGMLALLRYDDGVEKCVGCDLCEAACPSRVSTLSEPGAETSARISAASIANCGCNSGPSLRNPSGPRNSSLSAAAARRQVSDAVRSVGPLCRNRPSA